MDKIQKRINELKVRISNKRLKRNKKDDYMQCQICKEHVDDCFCPDNAKLELKGIKFVLKEVKNGKEKIKP